MPASRIIKNITIPSRQPHPIRLLPVFFNPDFSEGLSLLLSIVRATSKQPSVSGYTDEAIGDAIHRLEGSMMLLFGPEDLTQIMTRQATFSSVLDAKFHAAMMRREIVVDDKNHRR